MLAGRVRWRRLWCTEKNGTYVSEFGAMRTAQRNLAHHPDAVVAGEDGDVVFGQRSYRTMAVAMRGRIGFGANARLRRLGSVSRCRFAFQAVEFAGRQP